MRRQPINESVANVLAAMGAVTINEMVISSANAATVYADHVDISPLAGTEDKVSLAFKPDERATIVPVSALRTNKNQNDDPKYKAGLKRHPVNTAAKAMAAAIAGQGERRAPIQVKDNGDGTYEVLDGNATSQAAMMAGWEEMPVIVVGGGVTEAFWHKDPYTDDEAWDGRMPTRVRPVTPRHDRYIAKMYLLDGMRSKARWIVYDPWGKMVQAGIKHEAEAQKIADDLNRERDEQKAAVEARRREREASLA